MGEETINRACQLDGSNVFVDQKTNMMHTAFRRDYIHIVLIKSHLAIDGNSKHTNGPWPPHEPHDGVRIKMYRSDRHSPRWNFQYCCRVPVTMQCLISSDFPSGREDSRDNWLRGHGRDGLSYMCLKLAPDRLHLFSSKSPTINSGNHAPGCMWTNTCFPTL